MASSAVVSAFGDDGNRKHPLIGHFVVLERYGHAEQQHALGGGRDIDGLAIDFAGLGGGNIELIRAGRPSDIIAARHLDRRRTAHRFAQ